MNVFFWAVRVLSVVVAVVNLSRAFALPHDLGDQHACLPLKVTIDQ